MIDYQLKAYINLHVSEINISMMEPDKSHLLDLNFIAVRHLNREQDVFLYLTEA